MGSHTEERPLSLSVVIPALDEEPAVGRTVARVLGTRDALDRIGVILAEVIVVDDGSSDRTAEIVRAAEGARLICHDRTRGYGAALKTGFSAAKADLLAFLDADGTYQPEQFPRLCEAIRVGTADMAVGSRRSGEASRMPLVRRIGNLLWSTLVSLFGGLRILDPASGMRVFRRAAWSRLQPLPDGLSFTPVMTMRAVHEGLKLVEIPVPYDEREGHSKLRVMRDGTRFLKTIVWTLLEYNPAGILGLIGVVPLSISVLIGLGLILMRLEGITQLSPAGVLGVYAALVLAVTGVSLCSLAITFNYLVMLFHRRPLRRGRLAQLLGSLLLDRHFGWMGLILLSVGAGIAATAILLGLSGWTIERLWLWLVGSALFLLVGVQLLVSWLLLRVFDTINEQVISDARS